MIPRDPALFEAEHNLNFANKALLRTAFVHSSYVNELDAITQDGSQEDNERLEFLGDSVLGFVVSEWLFARFPNSREGELTAMRAALVKREALARFAKRLGLGAYLLLGHGEEESGGRKRTATLAATFEAVVCAIYLDQGRDAVSNFLLPILQAETERETLHALHKDPKSRLQEWSQGTLGTLPRYKLIDHFGPDHAKTFVFQVLIKEARVGIGEGKRKQEAQLAAAAMALYHFNLPAPEYVENVALEKQYPSDPLE
jgi:ribonuclease-3